MPNGNFPLEKGRFGHLYLLLTLYLIFWISYISTWFKIEKIKKIKSHPHTSISQLCNYQKEPLLSVSCLSDCNFRQTIWNAEPLTSVPLGF